MMKWLLGLAFSAAATSAQAGAPAQAEVTADARYRLMSVEPDHIQYLDEHSVRKNDDKREFVLLAVWAEPRPGDDGKGPYLYLKAETRIDCAAWKVQGFDFTLYERNGTHRRLGAARVAMAIAKGSSGEVVANHLCKDKLDRVAAAAPLKSEPGAVDEALGFLAQNRKTKTARFRLISAVDGLGQFVDEASVTGSDASRDFTLLVVGTKPVPGDEAKAEHSYGKYRIRIDCSGWTVSNRSATLYTQRGPDRRVGLPGDVKPIHPGSMAEVAANHLCKGQLNPDLAKARLVTEDEAVRAGLAFAAAKDRREREGK